MGKSEKNWKLKLRYGKLRNQLTHYTIIAPVVITHFIDDFDAKPGKAYAGVKIWAHDANHAFEIFQDVGSQIGYEVTGKMELYKTDPEQAPDKEPYAYGINFSYYE